MASRVTRASAKRTANEASPISASPTKQPKKRTKKDDTIQNTASTSKPQPQQRSKKNDAKSASTSTKAPRIAGDHLQLFESNGDIFEAPAKTLIIHACNCDGSWGAGIAKAFKDRYPEAFDEYKDHCDKHGEALIDSAQLIPPAQEGKAKHFVGCLYTSRHYGRKKDKPARILEATAPAMVDLLKQVDDWNAKHEESERVGEVRMCKINSGMFAVPWEKTKQVLEGIDASESDVRGIKVVSPPS